MTINEYVAGEVVRVSNAFTNSGIPYDPSAVKLDVRQPDGTEDTYELGGVDSPILKDSTGNYHADLDTTEMPGYWHYKWYSTGTGPAAAQGTFNVKAFGES